MTCAGYPIPILYSTLMKLKLHGRFLLVQACESGGPTMKRLNGIFLLLATTFTVCAVPVLAHHAFTSEFDDAKMVTVKGVLTKVDWINPHAYLYVDVKEQNGNIKYWAIETFPPAALRRAGMERDMLKIGDSVTVEAYGARDGKNLGWAHKVQFSDGRTIIFARDAPGGPASSSKP
jgi:Family of unknown function (DUF6152)